MFYCCVCCEVCDTIEADLNLSKEGAKYLSVLGGSAEQFQPDYFVEVYQMIWDDFGLINGVTKKPEKWHFENRADFLLER